MRVLPLLVIPALLAGCGAALPALPSHGGPAWRELQSEHFTLWTDTSPARATELIHEMEDLRQVVIGTAFHSAAEGRGFVIALHDDGELHEFILDKFGAISVPPAGTPLRQPMIVLSAESNVSDSTTIEAHELTHLVSHAVIHQQPHWFAEGLAQYFQTVKIDARAGTADVGVAPTRRGAPAHMHHLTSIASIMACTQTACLDAGFYATAWALFTYLINQRPADLAKLEQRLEELHGDGATAWTDVFGPGSVETVDADLRRWLANGKHTVLHFNIALAQHVITERALSDADVLAVRGYLRAHFDPHGAPAVARDIDAALALDPTNVLARVVGMALARPHDVAGVRATAAAHPDDWRAWWLVAGNVPPGDEATAARGKACALAASNPALVLPAELCPPR